MRRTTPIAILTALTLVVAACAGDTAPPIGPGTTSSSVPPTTAAPTTAGTAPASSTTDPSVTTSPPATPATLPPFQGLGLEVVADGLATPVFVTAPPGDDRLFVIEKAGRIRVIGGAAADDVFLDVRSLIIETHMEQGLLGMAFHPGYADNGRFFIYYTDSNGNSNLVEYLVSDDDPDRADPASASVVLTQEQPRFNHNGGMVAFGPDGYLYLGLGDGGGGNDRYGNGQRADTLLGAILRLDVDSAVPYAVPPDNPFVDGGGAPEVWAYGLRNPWRFDIDGGLIYVADVGQAAWEEIDLIPLGEGGFNFGWPLTEGRECGEKHPGCDPTGFTMPVVVYSHDEGCSVTGGYVYRGSAFPELDGHYFYADWCGGWVRSFRYEGGVVTDETDWSDDLGSVDQIVSFGRDGAGEIYIVVQEGTVFRIVPVR